MDSPPDLRGINVVTVEHIEEIFPYVFEDERPFSISAS
jgi:hypothetical protein